MIFGRWLTVQKGLEDAYRVRETVFVQEQGFALETERDSKDAIALHVVLYDGNLPIGTARLIPEGGGAYHIGRVAVLKEYRGMKMGDSLMRLAFDKARALKATHLFVDAQCQAAGFYAKLGFKQVGEEYLDEGVPHIHMALQGEDWENLGGCACSAEQCSSCSGCANKKD